MTSPESAHKMMWMGVRVESTTTASAELSITALPELLGIAYRLVTAGLAKCSS